MARRVVAADGRQWKVGRRIAPGRPKWRGGGPRQALRNPLEALDVADLLGEISEIPVVGGVFLVLAVLVFTLGLLGLLAVAVLFAVEVAALVLLLVLGVLARVVLRRPWTVEAAVPRSQTCQRWSVVGWRESGELIDRIVRSLETNGKPLTVNWRQ